MSTGIRLKGQIIMNRLNIALTRRGLLAAGAAGTAAAAGISSSASAQTASSATASTARKGFDAAAKNSAKFAPEPLPIQDAQGLKLTHTFSLGESTLSEYGFITAARWGVVRGHVKGGKIMDLTPFEHDYAPSINLDGLRELPYTPSRIRYPMVREGFLKNGRQAAINAAKKSSCASLGTRHSILLPRR